MLIQLVLVTPVFVVAWQGCFYNIAALCSTWSLSLILDE